MEKVEEISNGGDEMPPLQDQEAYYDDDAHPTVSLQDEIDVQALMSEKGTNFQIKDSEVDITNDDEWDIGEEDIDNDFDEPSDVKESLNSAMQPGDSETELSPFQRLAETMKDITEDNSGKVKKKILQAGVGPVVPERSIVRVFYSGRLEHSEEPFDSTYLQSKNRPRSFKLGDGLLLPGLDLAVGTMRRDEICMVLIHPDYFMGKLGCPPRIPPNATVLFRIELVGFSDRSGVHDYYDLPRAERKEAPIETILQVVKIERDEAKKFFKARRFRPALSRYRKAASILEECHLADADAETKQQAELLVLYRNAAVCSTKLSEANSTIMFANKALRIDEQDSKSWFLKGKGLTQQSEFDAARNAFLKAKNLKPNDPEIAKALQELNSKFKQFSLMESATCKRMFSSVNAPANCEKSSSPESATKSKAAAAVEDDPLLDVSEEFKRETRQQLQLFKESSSTADLPFPSSRMTMGEICCLIEVAEEIGLTVKEVGEGSNHHYRFCKSKPTS